MRKINPQKPHIYKKRGRWQIIWAESCPIELIEEAGIYINYLNTFLRYGER